ncbi:Fur family transcriptional regulator, ferric uptake regulator [Cyclobacterium lianum]|uniref:Fur family transcriptional regulator, ferric uptake regulator n=1 Tax=Cyclobacterium lianum TaxID=388280 RepID=A0A1M7MDI8_9BACT|nr:transcriptional repressor [Cyclobacterium lianum]SHM88801.1 Fur family transcriptional regulator, ferric uptake regulator [Cyclobacterium lianum]
MRRPEKILQDHAIVPTIARIEVIEYIINKKTACSLKELQQALAITIQQEKPVLKTTIYRTIDLFEEIGIVHKIDDGTETAKYAITKQELKDWHFHFHCLECGETFCLAEIIPKRLLAIGKRHQIKEVNLVLKGICEKCNQTYF